MIGSDPRLHPIGQNWALWIMARGAGAGDNTWAHDFRFRDEGRAKQHRLRAFAVPTYGLFHGDKAVIAAQNPASLPPGLKQRHPLAIGRRVAGHVDAPAVFFWRARKPHAHGHWNSAHIEECQGAVVVQLSPGIKIPGPDAVPADLGVQKAQLWRVAEFAQF